MRLHLIITTLLTGSIAHAATLAPGQVLTATFTSVSNTSDLLFLFSNASLSFTGSPLITTKLFNGATLLGTTVAPLSIFNGTYFYSSVFKSLSSTFSSPDPTAVVNLTSMQNGTIQGSIQVTVTGGSISGFDVFSGGSDPNGLVLYDAQNGGGGSYFPEGDLRNQNFTLTNPGAGYDFYPVTPCRVTDTRVPAFGNVFGPPSFGAATTRTFNIFTSPCAIGIPSSATAFSLNFTVVPPSGGPPANITTWAAGQTMPNVSTLNYSGSVVANAAIVPANNGSINVFANFPTDVLFDIDGYFAPASSSGLVFFPLTPCRITDTRVGSFPAGFGPPSMASGETRVFNIPNNPCAASIPANVAAYSMNFTVVPPSGGPAANLTTWPTGSVSGIPNVSTLNYSSSVVANAAIIPSGSGNAINVFTNFRTDLLFDINGYFAPSATAGLRFYPVTPCRIADTRVPSFPAGFGPPGLAAGIPRTFNILANPCATANSIPITAAAYSLNFTVVPPAGGPAANLTTWPAGLATPNVSTLNFSGNVVAGAAIVPAGSNGAISVYASFPTDVLFDINGYFAP